MTASPRLFVLQPTIQDYRVGLYNALSRKRELILIGEDRTVSRKLDPSISFIHLKNLTLPRVGIFWQRPLKVLSSLRRADVLLMNSNPRTLSNFLALWVARSKGARVVFWNHGRTGGSPGWRSWLRYRWERMADRNLLYYDTETPFAESMGLPRDRLFAAGNTIDTEAITEAKAHWTPECLQLFRKNESLENRQLVIFMGRDTPKANLPLLVQAFKEAHLQRPSLLLVVIGVEPTECARYFDQTSGLKAHVRCPGPLYKEEELAPWFLSSSLFCYPGSVGLSLVHAFAYGLPALIHDQMDLHMPEAGLMEPGRTGLTFMPDSVQGAVLGICELIDNPVKAGAMGAYARNLIMNKLTIEKMTSNILKACSFSIDNEGSDKTIEPSG